MFWYLLFTFLALLLFYFYTYVKKKYSYWSDKGIKGPNPVFPFGYSLSRALHSPDVLESDLTAKYGKVYGVYSGLLPTLTISDAELIKQVLVKDFPSFLNRRSLNFYDKIWNTNLFFNEFENWKRIRSICSPAFSSGKLKGMYPLIAHCLSRLDEHLKRTTEKDGILDVKQGMATFTIDVIASTAFATDMNANHKDRSKPSPFVFHGLNIFKFPPFKMMVAFSLPRVICDMFNIHHLFPDESFQFFVDLTSKIVEERKVKPAKKNSDLIQMMIDSFTYEEDLENGNYDSLTASMDVDDENGDAKNATENISKLKKKMNTTEIIAQCILFFIAGFETTSATLTHALFELASHPEMQERMVNELEEQLAGVDKSDLNKYYDVIINKTPYLEAVVKETLRKYSPVARLERRVVAEQGVDLGHLHLDHGVLIEIPTISVHFDPEYYPEPEKFNPERFMPENKHLLVPYTYLPFGQGPRNCVGMRFAYQELKLCLASILPKYQFSKSAKTPDVLTFRKGQFMLNCFPFELSVKKRH